MKRNKYKTGKTIGSLRKKVLSSSMKDPWAGVGHVSGAFHRAAARGSDWRSLGVALAVCCAVGAAGLFRVWTRAESLSLGYAIAADEGRIRTAESERQRLTLEAASLSSPIRIGALARERLGMHPPLADQVVLLDGATSEEPQTTHAARSLARK